MIDTQPSVLWEDRERLEAIADLAGRVVAEFDRSQWPNLFKIYWFCVQIGHLCSRRRAWLEKHRETVLDCLNDL